MFESLPFTLKLPCMILALLIAIIGHEIMHGLVAYRYGDDTAKVAGRLSINPLSHIDLVGSIIIPLALFIFNAPFLFGWAKPVPVRMDRVINNGGYLAAFNVSVAGVSYNFLMAILASFLIYAFSGGIFSNFFEYFENPQIIFQVILFFCLQLMIYNVILGVFNCFPVPPLDGSNALSYLGLHFESDFFAQIFSKINPIFGTIFILILLSTPLSFLLIAPVNFITQWLLSF